MVVVVVVVDWEVVRVVVEASSATCCRRLDVWLQCVGRHVIGRLRRRRRRLWSLLLLFSFLCSSVLEPDLDLSIGESYYGCQFRLPLDGDVWIVEELLFQLHLLVFTVDDAVLVLGSRLTWKKQNNIDWAVNRWLCNETLIRASQSGRCCGALYNDSM